MRRWLTSITAHAGTLAHELPIQVLGGGGVVSGSSLVSIPVFLKRGIPRTGETVMAVPVMLCGGQLKAGTGLY